MEVSFFVEEIGVEMWIILVVKLFNIYELFIRIVKMVSIFDFVSLFFDVEIVLKSGVFLDGFIISLDIYLLDDMFFGKGVFVRYFDLVLLNMEREEIEYIVLFY